MRAIRKRLARNPAGVVAVIHQTKKAPHGALKWVCAEPEPRGLVFGCVVDLDGDTVTFSGLAGFEPACPAFPKPPFDH